MTVSVGGVGGDEGMAGVEKDLVDRLELSGSRLHLIRLL